MRTLFTILSILVFTNLHAQIGISTTGPEGILDISSTNQGVVLPVVALTDLTTEVITNPQGGGIVAGTLIYNTATTSNGADSVYPGLYFWNGSKWIPQLEKKQNTLVTQTSDLRTGSSDILNPVLGDQSITFDAASFTPTISGNYKVVLTVHYGGGNANLPSPPQYVNFAEEQGEFEFIFNGSTHNFIVGSYSGNNDDNAFDGGTRQDYYNSANQVSFVTVESLTAGTPYAFTLTFNQEDAPGFEGDGDISLVPAEDGRGYITINDSISCTIEFNYVGE